MKRTIRALTSRAIPFLLTLALVLGAICIAPPPARAAGVDITDRFEDDIFRSAVRDELNLPAGAPIYDTDVARIKVLYVDSKGIKSLAGIEYFTALEWLNCVWNQLTSLDVTSLHNLNSLVCFRNNLTTLEVTGLENLQTISCSDNQLTELRLSDLPNLRDIYCYNNQLTKLDLTGSTKLSYLDCDYNQLTELKVSGLSNLTYLSCDSNQLSVLDTTGLSSVEMLTCDQNQLTELNLSGLPNLKQLYCSLNQLTSLDFAIHESLTVIHCINNQLISLDVTALTNLLMLSCSNNQLKELKVSGLKNLQHLFGNNNRLTTLDVSGLGNLFSLYCYSNQLTSLDVTGLPNLSSLECQYNYMNSEADIIGDISSIYSFNFSPQNAPGFYGVTNIFGVPNSAVAYTPLPLTGTVFPSDATNTTIEWSVLYPYNTDATIVDNIFYATSADGVHLRAAIKDGLAEGVNYEQYFYINVTMPDNVLPFFDVPENMWYHEYVKTAYADGLVNGKAPGFYYPEDNMTVAEAVKIAACMHQLHNEYEVTLTNAPAPTPWYASYMYYALQNNIIDADLSDVADTMITRKDFVYILYAALPKSEYDAINNVADDAIPDVKISSDTKYAPRIYTFYRAGILTGSDTIGTFNPESNIKRNEVAAVLTRMLHQMTRQSITLY